MRDEVRVLRSEGIFRVRIARGEIVKEPFAVIGGKDSSSGVIGASSVGGASGVRVNF
jgi:hypothetical protein